MIKYQKLRLKSNRGLRIFFEEEILRQFKPNLSQSFGMLMRINLDT